ncbi:MAG: hypothetical protein WAS07_09255 [Micropruina sp.]|nr:hypothetical protein [Micropruina sp.]
MGKRFFWFTVGVALTALIVLKGKEYYHRFTPAGVTEQVEKASKDMGSWVADFIDTVSESMHEREADLRDALGLDGETTPVQAKKN